MNFNKTINKTLSIFGFNLMRVPSPLINKPFINLPKNDYKIEGNKIFLKKLSLSINKNELNPLLEDYKNALRIVNEIGGVFYYSEKNELMLKIGELNIYINDAEELLIVNEVFSSGSYNILPATNSMVVIDVGMNVGITSLFFAIREDVEEVYSYELFEPTYEKAKLNIDLNDCGKKIQAFNYGLGKEEMNLKLNYSPEQKGRMGLNGLPSNRNYTNTSLQNVTIKKVSDEFSKIRDIHSNDFVVCKMDCEGAEYDLIHDLHENGALDKIDAYMIEWHYKKPDVIIDSLMKQSFTVFYFTFPTGVAGMLYAIKK